MSVTKVNLLIIGAARSATTSISRILTSHPDVCFCTVKEPQFFSKADWRDHLEDYNRLFNCDDKTFYVDGSTNYSKFPNFNRNIHQDIFEYNPDMKFIYMMRNPLDRIVSHYNFAIERGLTTAGIDEEILKNRIYTDSSKYFEQIDRYLKYFPFQRFKFIFFEDLINDPKDCIASLYDFLGIQWHDYNHKDLHSNKSNAGHIGHIKHDDPKTIPDYIKKAFHVFYRRMKPVQKATVNDLQSEVLNKLRDELLPDIERLEGLLNRDLNSWKNSFSL
ncbi:MAG: hypothetical protein HKO90_04600 [Flavobacteriaceae bacterium]|nr:hypothetical protein [Flavobacteriaceae bacterium]